MNKTVRGLAIAVLALSMLVLAACESGLGTDSPVGIFALITVDGRPLPWDMGGSEGQELAMTQARISFASDFSCSGTFTLREDGVTWTRFQDCTWERDGAGLEVRWQDGPSEEGALSGNRLSLESAAGALWVLERRRSRGLGGGSGSQGAH